MNKEILNLMNKDVLIEAAKKYNTTIWSLKFIGNNQNFVYEYTKKNIDYILRITHSSHRNEQQILGELEWILYLSENEIKVSKPVYSKNEFLIERIDIDNGYFIVTSFEKAIGKKLLYPEFINNELVYERCGRLTGKIHALSKNYISLEMGKRNDWTQNFYLKSITKDNNLFREYNLVKDELRNLKKDKNNFGLIHGDINLGNFFVNQSQITLFDFDECQYSWFIEDIAIQLFYATYIFLDDSIDEREKCAAKFIKYFMKGYCTENNIDDNEIMHIPIFLRLREIIVYRGMQLNFNMNELNGWTKDYAKQSKSRIEKQIPLIRNIFH